MQILVIKLSSIGDVVLLTPALAAIKEKYPESKVSMLVEESSYPIVQYNPNIDEIFVFEREKLYKIVKKKPIVYFQNCC